MEYLAALLGTETVFSSLIKCLCLVSLRGLFPSFCKDTDLEDLMYDLGAVELDRVSWIGEQLKLRNIMYTGRGHCILYFCSHDVHVRARYRPRD